MYRPDFRLWGSPWTGYATLVFLATVLVLMGFDYPIGTWTLATLVIIIPGLMIGWRLVRDRVQQVALEREGYTGAIPIRAERPIADDTTGGPDDDEGQRI